MNCRTNPISGVMFYPMEADGTNYPKAAVPLLPTASWSGWSARKPVSAGSAFLENSESFIRGRYALAEAMRRAGAGAGKVVLLPAFHCRAVVEPVLYLGAQPCFYPVKADLRPDFSALSSLVNEGGAPVAAMVMTHYFGFPNDLDEAERFCAAHGIALIEDCAHALYGRAGGRLLGTVGSYATASVWKFLPVRDGGLLLDNTGGQPARRAAQPLLAEAKAWAAVLRGWSQRIRHHNLPVIDAPMLCKQAKLVAALPKPQMTESDIKKRRYIRSVQAEPVGAFTSFLTRTERISTSSMRTDSIGASLKEFSPQQSAMAALRSSRWLTAHAAHERTANRRRANYLRWLEGVRPMPGVKPLFPYLPEGVVPYAFPLLIDAAGMGFHRLKMAGIPLWRWEDMAVTDCAISRDYRIRVLQLPCHQELHDEELDWMTHAVQALLAEPG